VALERSVVQGVGNDILVGSYGVAVEYEASVGLSMMWLGITVLTSAFLMLELIVAFRESSWTAVANTVLSGTDFQLEVQDGPAEEPEQQPLCAKSYRGVIKRGFLVVLVVGMLCGEAAVPTHMVYSQWLFIDCVSIGTFERVFFVLFPRFGILGITGVVYHATGITVHVWQALFLLLLTPALAGSFLTLVTILSLKGYELDWAYWLAPVFASVAMVVVLMGYVLCVPKKNNWAPRLGLKTCTDSAVVTRNLASVPPFWFQVAVGTLELHNEPKPRYIQVHNCLVDLLDADNLDADNLDADNLDADNLDAEKTAAFIMDATSQQAQVEDFPWGDFQLRRVHGLNDANELQTIKDPPWMFALRRVKNVHNEEDANGASLSVLEFGADLL